MNRLALTVILILTAAAPVLGEPEPLPQRPAPTSASKESSLVSQDPLMRQILHRQLTQHNGGITAAVRIASGQSIELELVELDIKPADQLKDLPNAARMADLGAGLRPAAGLIAAASKPVPTGKSRLVKKPKAQLKTLEQQGGRQTWGEGAKGGSEKLPEADGPAADSD